MYLVWVGAMNAVVNLLLLLCTDRLSGYATNYGRTISAAILGGVYAGACLLPGFHFLGNFIWRIVSFGLIALAAYGMSADTFRKGLVFAFLSLALSGAMENIEKGNGSGGIAIAVILLILSYFGFGGRRDGTGYVPIELNYMGKLLRLTALQDTGNTLRDPITGRPVLVVGADAAHKLTGLTKEQLQNPVETMGAIPGLQLIPYSSVDSRGFLLALRLQNVRIGKWQGSSLVAFAPEGLGSEGAYQALTGGNV